MQINFLPLPLHIKIFCEHIVSFTIDVDD